MPRTKPATRPLVETVDPYIPGQALIDEIIATRSRVIEEFVTSLDTLEIPASDPQRGRLCIVATEAGLRVALRSSMPSDEELSHEIEDYRFWFGLPPGVDKSQLGGLQPAALSILALLQSWVCQVNRMVSLGCPPWSAQVRSLTEDISAAATAFVVCLAATPAGSRAG